MKVINVLKQKSTRIVAFVSACIIFAVCVSVGLANYLKVQKSFSSYNNLVYDGENEEVEEMFAELWTVGNMYLRNLDENGKFIGSDELKNSTEKALKELGLMDEKGNITIQENENYNYYVSWGKNSISTDNKSFDDIYDSDKYSTSQVNGIFSHGYVNGYINYYDSKWYTTDYGMTYYDFPHTINGMMATAVFDYDTKNLDYYIDNLGVKIYYKKDGSTPVPVPETDSHDINISIYRYDEYSGKYYDDYGQEVMIAVEASPSQKTNTAIPEIPAELLESDGNSYILYNRNSNEWVEVKNYTTQQGNEVPLKICITPSEKILPLYRQVEADRNFAEETMTRFLLTAIPFLALSVILMIFFIVTSGYNTKKKKFVMAHTDNIWVEAVITAGVLLTVGACASLYVLDDFYDFIEEYVENYQLTVISLWTTAWTAIFALAVLCVNTLVKRLKCRSFWKTTLVYRIWKFVRKHIGNRIKPIIKTIKDLSFRKDMADNKIFARRFLIKLGIFVLASMFAVAINAEPVVWIIICALYVYLSLKDISAVNGLSEHINDIYDGDYSEKKVDMKNPTYTMTEKLNNISDGIQTAVDKRLQSERMKIDLVTNVSHDLKTPLTSIISYINLLSMEELSPVARDYVNILEKKSERLNEIVADVFDIAKATSRTDINFEMIDAVILVEQVLGDMSDRIEESGKEIRKTVSADTAPVYADGKKLYRVLQNIIDNALKYSLDNTRIYLTLKKENSNAVITVKNISSYEIKFTPEEITERFTRGDESRTTEGNGLGLSIAKSFTEACGGSFEIIIDGDVFEADVTLPITFKQTETKKVSYGQDKKQQ